MLDKILALFPKVEAFDPNILLLLGLALLGGMVGGRLFQKIKIPQVVGYIVIGLVIGESGFKFIGHEIILALQPFNYFALGLIGFMIGGELKKEILVKYGKQFINILLLEGTIAFLMVAVSIGFVGGMILGDYKLSWAIGLMLGAIASATAPAATTEVLRELKSRGPLTRTVLGIVAMDDALALFLFAIASSIAGSLVGSSSQSGLLRVFINPLYEIAGSILIGVICGFVLSKLLRRYAEEARLLAFSIGAVLMVLGAALAFHLDMLLAAMTLGVVVVNFIPRKSKDIFKLVEGFTPPIFVLFFVLVGAKINVSQINLTLALLGCIYLIARSFGKALGAIWGAKLSKAPITVQKYLPLCLFSQAGVAIGLSILASHYFPGYIGNAIVIIITITALILELIGPYFVKLAITKAKEIGLNVTEDDLVKRLKVNEIMDANPPLVYKNMTLTQVLTLFSESPNLYYPVVNKEKKFLGIVSVDNIKTTIMQTSLGGLVLAVDFMEPVPATVDGDSPISELKSILAKYNLECLPVVNKNNYLEGFVERRMVYKIISTKMVELQRQADLLESSTAS